MLRRYMPKSLYARTLLIVILPIFIMQSCITYFFFNRHWELVTTNLSANVAGQIALLSKEYEQAATPKERQAIFENSVAKMEMPVRFEENKNLPLNDKLSVFNVYNSTFDRKLSETLDYPYWFDTSSWPAYIEVRVKMNNGYLVFLPLRERVFATTGPIFVIWMVSVTILLGWIAIIFLRNQVRSILHLAHAAEDFGRGRDAPDYRPTGATEVRRAGYAFMAMRARIKRHFQQRTDMLSSVSHDLRTPLTRLKLALSMMEDNPEIIETRKDVEEMERMLNEYLAFVRDQSIEEEHEATDIKQLLSLIIEQMQRSGHKIEYAPDETISDKLEIEIQPHSVKRAIENIVNNSIRYADEIKLSVRKTRDNIEIIIDDNGPGIPPDQYEEVFKPFNRLDQSRNLNQSGVGLGLYLVRDIARRHGGEAILSRAPLGGLRTIISLPT